MMKYLIPPILLIALLFASPRASAKVDVVGDEKMIREADLIALVDIQELASTDEGTAYDDLLARAHVASVLKGVAAKTELKFRVPRMFPCAAFDVSTGMHLVFLKKDKNGGFIGFNWYMSYVYLGGKNAKWYNKNGVRVEDTSVDELIKRVKEMIAAVDKERRDAMKKRQAGNPAT